MAQTLDLLLNNVDKVKSVPTGSMEIKRLTKQLGEPFRVTFRAATLEELREIEEQANEDVSEVVRWTVYKLVTDPPLNNQELREAYNVARPVEVVDKIFLGGELTILYSAIKELSGIDDDNKVIIDEIKNS